MDSNSAWGSSQPATKPRPPPVPAPHSRATSAASNNFGGSSGYGGVGGGGGAGDAGGAGYAAAAGAFASQAAFSAPQGRSAREIELDTREAELRLREAKASRAARRVAQRERETGDYHPPNWPSFRPLVYHDIENDIPKNGQWLVKRVYTAWWLAAITFIINFIAAFALLIKKADGAGATFGMSLLLLVLGVPFSFVFWYRALYDGVKRDSSIKFMFFFFNYAVHLAAMGIFAIGITGWGGAGVIYTLSMFSTDMGAAVLCLIASCCFIFQIIYGLWQVKAVHGYWRSKGLTTEQARDQAIHTVASSRVGQEVGRAAVKQAVASNTR